MSVASLVSATFAIAATMNLPIFGFGGDRGAVTTTQTVSGDDEVSTTTTTALEPTIVEQVVYEDTYQRVARPVAPSAAAAVETPTSTTTAPVTTIASALTTTTTKPSTTTTASTTTRSITTTTRGVTNTGPTPPPGCLEPEWDREHQSWHCKGD
jgi:hypothetical protein